MNNELIIKQFDNQDVEFVIIDGESKVNVSSIAKFCGWTQVKNNKEYVRLERINKNLSSLGFPNVGENDFIPEYMMYPLIGKADFTKNIKARDFMLWVGRILSELRQSGVVILENASKETVDFKFKYGTYKIRKTFANSDNMREDYEEFKLLSAQERKAGRLNNADRVNLCKLIQKGIKDKVNKEFQHMRPSELLACQEILTDIQVDITKLENKKNGGKLASKTRENNKLKEELNYHNPKLEDYIEIDYHPFSVNSMYDSYIDDEGKLKKKRTESYNKWINNFPNDIITDNFGEVDLTRPTRLWLKFDCMSRFDSDNCVKSIQDQIVRALDYDDDNNISLGNADINERVDNYRDGKIYILLRNE